MGQIEKPTRKSVRATKKRSLVNVQTIALLQKSGSAREARAMIQKAVAGISDSDLLFVRGIHILLLM